MTGVLLAIAAPAGRQAAGFCGEGGRRAPAQLLPVDEASRQPEFFTFRARLQTAVAARDADAVVAMADPNIKLGFGGDDGAELLRASLMAADAAPYWREIASVLALGGAFKGDDSFRAPYFFAKWPDGADGFECGVIVGRSVNVRREPRADAAVVASASYDIVQHMVAGAGNPPEGWAAVELSNGTKGFVRADFLGGPTGLRALFNRVNGQWRLTALVAGD